MSLNLVNALEQVQESLSLWKQTPLNEEQTTQAIILRILFELGYDIWNPLEVVAQDRLGKDRPDFLVCPERNREPRLVLEVKRLGMELSGEAVVQALRYASRCGVRWAVITNGEDWVFCDEALTGPSAERVFLTLNLNTLGIKRFAHFLFEVLDSHIWQTPEPEMTLEKRLGFAKWELEQSNKLKVLSNQLSQAKVEEMLRKSGYNQEELSFIKQRLDQFLEILIGSNVTTTLLWEEALEAALARMPQTSGGDLKVYFGDRRIPLGSWASLHFAVAEALIAAEVTEKLDEIDFVSDSPEGQGAYPANVFRQLSNGRYLLLKAAAQTHRSRINRLLKALQTPDGYVEVWYKEIRYRLPS